MGRVAPFKRQVPVRVELRHLERGRIARFVPGRHDVAGHHGTVRAGEDDRRVVLRLAEAVFRPFREQAVPV